MSITLILVDAKAFCCMQYIIFFKRKQQKIYILLQAKTWTAKVTVKCVVSISNNNNKN